MALIKAKRFWTDVTISPDTDGFAVELDGRRVSTPAKTTLILPTQAAAQLVADEWSAVDGELDPATMPATRWANSAVDKVVPQHAAVAAMLAEYGGSDLLCYRADGPKGLQAAQSSAWDAPLAWAAKALNAPLKVTEGLAPIQQPEASLKNLSAVLHAYDPFTLAAVHDVITLTGSLILGLSVSEGAMKVEAAWAASRVDEDWQISQWGTDEEAESLAAAKRADVLFAARALRSLTKPAQ